MKKWIIIGTVAALLAVTAIVAMAAGNPGVTNDTTTDPVTVYPDTGSDIGQEPDPTEEPGDEPKTENDTEPGTEPEADPDPEPEPEPVHERVFYSDVNDGQWYYESVRALFDEEILPEAIEFRAMSEATRLDLVRWLYGAHLYLGGEAEYEAEEFDDVAAERVGHDAVMWARATGVVNGVSETRFAPDSFITREQVCTILMRFAEKEQLTLVMLADNSLFRDSLSISDYARSYVCASRMAGIVNGYEDRTFRPNGNIKRGECAAVVARILDAANAEAGEDTETVSTAPDAYLDIYDTVVPYVFGEPIAEGEEVDISWFDNAVFVGDSVSVRLEMYANSSGALSDAKFLCSTSMSAASAMQPVTTKSFHPSYNGEKMKVEDGIKASGAKNVYIMLGINEMDSSVSYTTGNMQKLIDKILEVNPDVNIIVESVTPITSTSTRVTKAFNNAKVDSFNAKMQELCEENGWYYLNVAEVFKDSGGYLKSEYSSDAKGMGIHFTTAAAKLWVKYLTTHVPFELQ